MIEIQKVIHGIEEEKAIFNSFEDIKDITDIDIIEWKKQNSMNGWNLIGKTKDSNIVFYVREIEIGKWYYND